MRDRALLPAFDCSDDLRRDHAKVKHNGTLVFALKVAITLAAFFLLARTLNWANVWSRVSATSWPSLCAAVGVSLIQIPLIGVRWGTIVARMLEGVGQAPRQRNLQRIVFSAQFVGQVLPVVAGDGLRMLMLREAGVPTAVAVKSTVLDRGFALAALFLVAVPGLAFSPLLMHTGALRATLLIVTVSSLCAGAVMLVLSRQIARALGSQPFLAEASKLQIGRAHV